MPFVPHTDSERRQMLERIGRESLDDLFRSIPGGIRLGRPLATPPRKTEAEILAEFSELAERNVRMDNRPCFLGAGVYRRFLPAAIDYLAGRGEFSTAYTPYQPEVSQGTLQAIFEYQTMICRLTAMEISNASMYEGGTALVEAVLMAHSVRGSGHKVFVSDGVHPEYCRVLETYLKNHPVEIVRVPLRDGITDLSALGDLLGKAAEDALAVAVQSPNFFGCIEDGAAVAASVQRSGREDRPLFIAAVDPVSLAVLTPPGEYGADVAVGDGQQLGNYPAYGGPSFGFFATRMRHVRKLPGRIVGETRDRDGKRGYVLTFQTREQHIRRERATSNICTNQGLSSLRAAMYLSLLGEQGLREVAETSARKAHRARDRLLSIPGIRAVATAPFFDEFAVELPLPAEEAYRLLGQRGITGGLPLSRYFPQRSREMLLAFTELTPLEHVEKLAGALSAICAGGAGETATDPRSLA